MLLRIVHALVVPECCFGCARLMGQLATISADHCLLTQLLYRRRRGAELCLLLVSYSR